MMRQVRAGALGVLFVAAALPAAFAAEFEDLLRELDRLHFQDHHEGVLERLEHELDSGAFEATGMNDVERARLVKRRARAIVAEVELYYHADKLDDRVARERLKKAEEYAAEAIALDPDLAGAYFWKGSAKGLRGLIRGVIRALFMASDVRDLGEAALERDPDHTEAHFLLSQLYDELPGRPLSFGNDARAVSLARRAYDLHEQDYEAREIKVRYDSVVTGLAERLWSRNWSERRRESRHARLRADYAQAKTPIERSYVYEGSLMLKPLSDRDEARLVLKGLLERLEAVENPSRRQLNDLEHSRELAGDWGL